MYKIRNVFLFFIDSNFVNCYFSLIIHHDIQLYNNYIVILTAMLYILNGIISINI